MNIAGMNIGKVLNRNLIKGGEVIARMLAAEGVDTVFGIVDGTYLGLCAGLRANGIKLITPRHETSALHMAGAYARLTGKLGVAMASNGPGVANALPGVAVEQAEGNRVLLITSCRREGIAYPERGGTYQYFPQIDVIGAMSKLSVAVPSPDRIAELMRRAFRTAWSGRPGVVHVDVPESIMNGGYEPNPAWFSSPEQYRTHTKIPAPASQVEQAVEMLVRAQRPIIHAGSGVMHAGASKLLQELAERLVTPVTSSWGARGVLDERSRFAVSMIHTDATTLARTESDVVLVLGSRLGETDWWGKAPYWGRPGEQKLIQVDIDPATIGNNRPADLGIQADVAELMKAMLDALRGRAIANRETREAFVDKVHAACLEHREKLDKHLDDHAVPMNPAHVAKVCREVFEDDAVLVVDGGNTAIWAHFFHQVRVPNTILGTAKMGMLGAGMAQALGAQAARPNKPVYCIIGDGAMGFHPQEIESAVRNDLPIIYIVLCDRQWGMVKMNQQFALKPIKTLIKKSLDPDETINCDLGEIEFDQLARAMGAHGERVADPAGLRGAIERARASKRCAVVHVDVDRVKHLWAPALKTFKDMHQEPKG